MLMERNAQEIIEAALSETKVLAERWEGRAKDAEERANAAQAANEEAQEIIGELTAALAVLHGEELEQCANPCTGHLGPKAREEVRLALNRWHDLEAASQQLAEGLRKLGAEMKRLQEGQAESPLLTRLREENASLRRVHTADLHQEKVNARLRLALERKGGT
jgi:hypothetical protein